jgi:uncharacterized membrane protein HdeD (DUF308 family)
MKTLWKVLGVCVGVGILVVAGVAIVFAINMWGIGQTMTAVLMGIIGIALIPTGIIYIIQSVVNKKDEKNEVQRG